MLKNKTIANWLIASLVTCVLGSLLVEYSNLFFTLGGLGLVIFTVIADFRLYKLNKTDWLFYVFTIIPALYILAVLVGGSESLDVTLLAIVYWVFAIWTIVRLYKIEDKK